MAASSKSDVVLTDTRMGGMAGEAKGRGRHVCGNHCGEGLEDRWAALGQLESGGDGAVGARAASSSTGIEAQQACKGRYGREFMACRHKSYPE